MASDEIMLFEAEKYSKTRMLLCEVCDRIVYIPEGKALVCPHCDAKPVNPIKEIFKNALVLLNNELSGRPI